MPSPNIRSKGSRPMRAGFSTSPSLGLITRQSATASSMQRIRVLSMPASMNFTVSAPAAAPRTVRTTPRRQSRHGISPARKKCQVAAAEPKVDCSLLVPSASCGGSPQPNRAGTVISPPPPATESMNPATTAAANRSAS